MSRTRNSRSKRILFEIWDYMSSVVLCGYSHWPKMSCISTDMFILYVRKVSLIVRSQVCNVISSKSERIFLSCNLSDVQVILVTWEMCNLITKVNPACSFGQVEQDNSYFMLNVYCSLLIAHCLLLIDHCSLLVANCSLLIAFCSSIIAHCLLLIAHCS